MDRELKLFVKFRNEDVRDKAITFMDDIWKHKVKLIRDFEVTYVDEYEDAQYGTVYAVTDYELNLIGIFAKHEPLTYREVVELIREDSGEMGVVVLFDITGYTGLDYNMPEYFKGDKNETDAFLEEPNRENSERDEDLPISLFSTYLQFHRRNVLNELAESNRKVEEMVNREEEDAVNQPSHYTSGDIEVIEYIEQQAKVMYESGTVPPEVIPHICNAIKYISRFQSKGKPVEDLNKSIYYINRAIKKIEDGD